MVETDDTDDEQQQLALDPLSQLEEDLRNIRSVIHVTRDLALKDTLRFLNCWLACSRQDS